MREGRRPLLPVPSRRAPSLLLTAALLLQVQPVAASGEVQAGRAVFASRCASCHPIGPSARAGFGPHLQGVIGRAAASTPDYAYSPALRRSGLVWSEETLAAFLKDPDAVVPGTRMRFSFYGFRREKQIADLLAYLRTMR